MIERDEYLRRCKLAAQQMTRGRKYHNHPSYNVWAKIDYTGKRHYLVPVEYRLSYDRAGRVVHGATLHEATPNGRQTAWQLRLEDLYLTEEGDK